MRKCSSCVCTLAQHHSLSNRMSSLAASCAGAAGVCAYARKEAHDTARALRAAPEHNSWACWPCPLVSPRQNRSGGQPGMVTPRRDRGSSGARGAGRWFCPGAWGAGRWSAPPSAPATGNPGKGSEAHFLTNSSIVGGPCAAQQQGRVGRFYNVIMSLKIEQEGAMTNYWRAESGQGVQSQVAAGSPEGPDLS